MAAESREEQRRLLPVSESRSSVRSGLFVKESLRFMEDFAFPSFPSNSLRSSFGVLVKGDNLSLLCERGGGKHRYNVRHFKRSKYRHTAVRSAEPSERSIISQQLAVCSGIVIQAAEWEN
ncbi:hypothetical protein EYF80_001255 [Liparis tanakae]|uniref:Uncharacterized protein n=1 Tax=Liparis tanakae TaxID=230148 RepID=A0A4Z2JFA3_9TELE|nr:hypothetical protein EYF80_001255 [Liparis tanakae]